MRALWVFSMEAVTLSTVVLVLGLWGMVRECSNGKEQKKKGMINSISR